MVGKNPPGHRPCRPVSEVRQPDRPLTESPKSAETTETTETTRTHAENPSSHETCEPIVSDRKQNAQTRPGRSLFYRKRQRETLRGAPSLMDDFLPSGSIKPTHRNLRPPSAEKKNKGKRLVAFPPCIGNFPSSDYSACRTAVIRSRSSGDDWAMYSAAAAF